MSGSFHPVKESSEMTSVQHNDSNSDLELNSQNYPRRKPLKFWLVLGGGATVLLIVIGVVLGVTLGAGGTESSGASPEYIRSSDSLAEVVGTLPADGGEVDVVKVSAANRQMNASKFERISRTVGNLNLKEVTAVTLEQPDKETEVCDKKCSVCDHDVHSECNAKTGQCSWSQYDLAADTNVSCPIYVGGSVPKRTSIMFEGFTNKKTYDIDIFDPPDTDQYTSGEDVPEKLYKTSTVFGNREFQAVASFFTPKLGETEVALALRVDVTGLDTDELLKAFPVLNGVASFKKFEVCRGVIVVSTSDFTHNGYDIVAGLNILIRVRLPNLGYQFQTLETIYSPLKASDVYNLRLRLPVEKLSIEQLESGQFDASVGSWDAVSLEFQKDPNYSLLQNLVNRIDKIGYKVPFGYKEVPKTVQMGAAMNFNLPGGFKFYGFSSANSVKGASEYKMVVCNVDGLPFDVSFMKIPSLAISITGDLLANTKASRADFVARVVFEFGSWKPELDVLGAFESQERYNTMQYALIVKGNQKALEGSLKDMVVKIGGTKETAAIVADVIGSLPISLRLSFATGDLMEIHGERINRDLRIFLEVNFDAITSWPKAMQDVYDFLGITPSKLQLGVVKGGVSGWASLAVYLFVKFRVKTVAGAPFQFNEVEFGTGKGFTGPATYIAGEWQFNIDASTSKQDSNGTTYPLYFWMQGIFDPTRMKLHGALKGTWKNVAGIEGFELENVEGFVEFNPTGVVQGIGAAGRITLKPGTFFDATVVFYYDMGFIGGISSGVAAYVQNWSFEEVWELVEKLSKNKIPNVVGQGVKMMFTKIKIYSANITVVPFGLNLVTKKINPGFLLQARMRILEANCSFHFGLQEKTYPPNIMGYDFMVAGEIKNLTALALLPGAGLIRWVVLNVGKLIDKLVNEFWDKLSVVGISAPRPNIEDKVKKVVADAEIAINKGFTLHRLYFTNFSLASIFLGGENIKMGVNVTLFGNNYDYELEVDPNFLVTSAVEKAKQVFNGMVEAVVDFLNNAKDKVNQVLYKLLEGACDFVKDILCVQGKCVDEYLNSNGLSGLIKKCKS